jgi:heme A synthase
MRRFAIVTASLTFLLLLLGGLVHNTRSSLACPDWPLCFGQLFPKMEGGVLVEHSHRLTATTVGVLTIALLVLCILRARRTGDRGLVGLGAAALGCVIAQGVLGGITVIYRLPTIVSTTHLAVSMLFFCILIYTSFRAGPQSNPPMSPTVKRITLIAGLTVYLQMILGALMRHLGAGLACVELPLCHDQLWPTDVHPAVSLHVVHRLMALVVLAVVAAASIIVYRNAQGRRVVRALALAAPALVLLQIALGVLSITSFLDVVPVTAHLGVAAALLGDLFALHLIARGPLGQTSRYRLVRVGDGVAA